VEGGTLVLSKETKPTLRNFTRNWVLSNGKNVLLNNKYQFFLFLFGKFQNEVYIMTLYVSQNKLLIKLSSHYFQSI